jgi:hypothetical protein
MSTVRRIAAVMRIDDRRVFLPALYFGQNLVVECFFRWKGSEAWMNIMAGVQNLESMDRGLLIIAKPYQC